MINNTPLSFGVEFLLHSVARPDAILDSIIRPLGAPTRVRGCILPIMIMVVVVDLIIIGRSMDLNVGVVLCIVVVIVVVCLVIIILTCAVHAFEYWPPRDRMCRLDAVRFAFMLVIVRVVVVVVVVLFVRVFRCLPCRWERMCWGRSVDVDMMVIVNVRRLR